MINVLGCIEGARHFICQYMRVWAFHDRRYASALRMWKPVASPVSTPIISTSGFQREMPQRSVAAIISAAPTIDIAAKRLVNRPSMACRPVIQAGAAPNSTMASPSASAETVQPAGGEVVSSCCLPARSIIKTTPAPVRMDSSQ